MKDFRYRLTIFALGVAFGATALAGAPLAVAADDDLPPAVSGYDFDEKFRHDGWGRHKPHGHYSGNRYRDENRRWNDGYGREARSGAAMDREDDGAGGYYGGNVSAFRQPGHGTYFFFDGASRYPEENTVGSVAPGAKVIDPASADPCGDVNGVCIIRPGD